MQEAAALFGLPAGNWPLLSSSPSPSTSTAMLRTMPCTSSTASPGAASAAAGAAAGAALPSCWAAPAAAAIAKAGRPGKLPQDSGTDARSSSKAHLPLTVLILANLLRLMRAHTRCGSTPAPAKAGDRSEPSSSRRPTASMEALQGRQGRQKGRKHATLAAAMRRFIVAAGTSLRRVGSLPT